MSNPKEDLDYTVLSEIGGVIKFPEKLINAKGLHWMEQNPDNEAYKRIGEFWSDQFILLPTPSYQQNGIRYLNSIQSAANNLIRATQIDSDDDTGIDWLQNAFNGLNAALSDSLCGKSGILSRYLAGYRSRTSMTFVCTGSPRLKHDEIELPKQYASKIGIGQGDIVMYCRHPILHELSIRFAHAVIITDSATGAIPYRNFHGLGADCDGDMIVVFAIPKEVIEYPGIKESVYKDMDETVVTSKMFGSMLIYKKEKCPEVGQKFVSVCPECTTINKLDMDELRKCASCGTELKAGIPMDMEILDIEERLVEDGLSFGPEDIGKDCDLLRIMEDNDVKKIQPDFFSIFEGNADLIEAASSVLREQSNIKLKLGTVGRTGSDALVAANFIDSPTISRSACYLKEKLSQQVLDCKHGEDLSNMEKMLNIVCKRGSDYAYLSVDEMLTQASTIGYNPNLLKPIFEYIMPLGVMNWVNRNSPVTRVLSKRDAVNLTQLEKGNGDIGGLGAYTLKVWEKWGIIKC